MRTRTWRARAIAWSAVLAWHALVAWWLLHGLRLPGDSEGRRLQVIYLELPPPPPPSPQPRSADAATATATATVVELRDPPAPPTAGQATATTAAPTQLETFRQQARALAEAAHPVTFAAPDPLASRMTPHSTAPAESFRARDRLTPARVLAKIGKIVGGPGYEADPCPRNRRNIDQLLAAGDSPALRRELEYEREYCRP